VEAVVDAFDSERRQLQSRIMELEIQLRSHSQALHDAQSHVLTAVTNPESLQETNATQMEKTPTARSMFDKINLQAKAIDSLNHQLQVVESDNEEKEELLTNLKQKCSELMNKVENLVLELNSRPTIRFGKLNHVLISAVIITSSSVMRIITEEIGIYLYNLIFYVS